MLRSEVDQSTGTEETIDLIAARIVAALRDDLEAIADELSPPPTPSPQLTVEQVARRLGVARSTVYAHWREWGGYKLGPSSKAPIRFDAAALPTGNTATSLQRPTLAPETPAKRVRRWRRRRDLLGDAPRLIETVDGIA